MIKNEVIAKHTGALCASVAIPEKRGFSAHVTCKAECFELPILLLPQNQHENAAYPSCSFLFVLW